MIDKNNKILIVGLGLLGGSYAEGLTDAGYFVGSIDKNPESIEYALNKKIIQEGITIVTKEFVEQYDIVIFGLYPKVFVEWLKEYQSYLKPNCIITDVTGIKTWLINEIESFIRSDISFVAHHPMAGKEVYGVQNSNKNMFMNANFIVTQTNSSTIESINVVKEIGRILNFKNIVELTKEEHDEMIGFLSQLTHCIAVSLMSCKDSKHLVKYTGDSFRDLTRIAKINENMWSELFMLNKTALLSEMDAFIEKFKEFREMLADGNLADMRSEMIKATKRRELFDKPKA